MELKVKILLTIIINLIFSIVLCFVFKFGLSMLIIGTVFVFCFSILYFFIGKIEIRLANNIFYIVMFLCFVLSYFIVNSNLGLRFDLYYWEKMILNENVLEENIEYTLKDRNIYDNEGNNVYSFYQFGIIEEGYITLSDKKLNYRMSFNNKCVIKDTNDKYIIISESCSG